MFPGKRYDPSCRGAPPRNRLEALRLTIGLNREELDHELRSRVGHGEFRRAHSGDTQGKLFVELAARRLEISLARFHFAAGKFPQVAVPLVRGPLADENSAYPTCDGAKRSIHLRSAD